MELKDFIKGVIFDITNAVKECQQELNNGAIIAPTGNWNNKNHIQSKELSALTVSDIDFEVSVSVGSSNEIAGSIGSGNTTKDENVHVLIQLVTCTRQPIRSTASRLQSRVIS